MVPSTIVVEEGLHLRYTSPNIRYILCNQLWAFLEHQMLKDKPAPLLAIKMWNFILF